MGRLRAGPRQCRSIVAGWILAWGPAILTLATPLGLSGEPTSPPPRETAVPVRGVHLEIIGTSYTTGDDGGWTRPIYSVAVGDPRPAEERAHRWAHRFGMYALDAALWTRVRPESTAQWRQTSLRRPATVAELETFAATPEAFKTEVLGEVGLLPHPFRDLDEGELARVEYVVTYALGGTRAELKIGVTAAHADALVRRMRDLLEANDENRLARGPESPGLAPGAETD